MFGNEFMTTMGTKMKEKFDKYWGTCNLLILMGAILDPRNKFKLIDFAFKAIYSDEEAEKQRKIVKDNLYALYQEYVDAHKAANVASSGSGSQGGASQSHSSFTGSGLCKGIRTGTAKYDQYIRSVDAVASDSSELDVYLEEGVYIGEKGVHFDALGWWKEKNLRFKILSKMAADILAIPLTTVASESAFSAGGRVIDPHRSSLGTQMVDMLICGADWYRHHYGIHKKKKKENHDIVSIELEE